MKVLHIISGEYYAGAERVQDHLALRLPEFGFEVGFVCLKSGTFADRRLSMDSPLYQVQMRSRLDLACGGRVARVVRGHGYQLVHTHTPRGAMVGRIASSLAHVPMVHHVHSPTNQDSESGIRNLLNTLAQRASLAKVKRLLPVSKSLGRYLEREGYRTDLIRVVPNGVPWLGPLRDRATPTREWVLGAVALFRPRKGVEVLIESLSQLRAKGLSVRLRCVGPFESPDYEKQITKLAERLGVVDAIDWVGYSADVNSELARMDLFLLPSLYGEGMPMVVLEAMAAGVPVIATNVEGVPEVLEQGRSGVIVPPGDSTALAHAKTSPS
jgi:glycosyltransferase involved in cell wall biosynthesis